MKNLLFITCITLTLAGGWNQKKNSGFFKLETRYLNASKWYDLNGNKSTIPTLKNIYTSLYGEYGLSETFTIIGKIPFTSLIGNNQSTEYNTPLVKGEKLSSFGDISLGFRYGLDQHGSFVYAISSETEFATGKKRDTYFTIGDGETNSKIGFEIGVSLNKSGYITSSFTYNLRGKNYHNESIFNFEYGINVTKSILTSIKTRTVIVSGDLTSGGSLQTEYTAYSIEANYFLQKNLGISVGFESAINVKNNFAAPIISAGIFLAL